MGKKHYYKENIKDRMYKNAANFWGVRNTENFDPVVKLLIEALASEVYKLSNEINNIETRVLERIAYLLTPDLLMTVRPAHMLLHTQPLEAKGVVNKINGFYYDNPVFKQKNKITDISFYPVAAFPLFKSRVKALVCGKNLYHVDEMLNKEIISRSTVRSEVFSQSVWFGLQLDDGIDSIKNLSFYFDFVNAENKNDFFHLLPYTNWQHKSTQIKVSQGIYSLKDTMETGDMSLFSNYDLANVSDDYIRRFYNHRFLMLNEEMKVPDMEKEFFPEELVSLFPETAVQQMQEALYWFHVTFPPAFNEEIIDRLLVGTNVFPVANKNLHSRVSKNLKVSSVIPLTAGDKEYFLSVHSVVDSQNRHYKQLPCHDKETKQYGTYSIKRGGTERFDSRDAKEYISYLIDILRDEVASFALIGKGFLDDFIDKIGEMTTILNQRLNEIERDNEVPSYLIIDSESEDEIIYVDYWLSNCELVNNLKAGSFFAPYNETFVQSEMIVSMTTCVGGKGRPNSTNAVDMYKYILSGRDRIYTSEDVVNFCFSEFGDLIVSVEVKKGVQVSLKPKEGLVRTIDVFIEMGKQFNTDSSEDFKDNLYNLLKEKSPDSFNYRIFINK